MKKVLLIIVAVLVVGAGGLYFGGFFDKGEVTAEDNKAADDVADELLNQEVDIEETMEVVPEEVDSTLQEAASEFDDFEENFDPEAEL